MKELITKFYSIPNFPIYLSAIIAVLVVAFGVVYFLGKKDQRKIEYTQRLQKLDANALAQMNVEVPSQAVQPATQPMPQVQMPMQAPVQPVQEEAPAVAPAPMPQVSSQIDVLSQAPVATPEINPTEVVEVNEIPIDTNQATLNYFESIKANYPERYGVEPTTNEEVNDFSDYANDIAKSFETSSDTPLYEMPMSAPEFEPVNFNNNEDSFSAMDGLFASTNMPSETEDLNVSYNNNYEDPLDKTTTISFDIPSAYETSSMQNSYDSGNRIMESDSIDFNNIKKSQDIFSSVYVEPKKQDMDDTMEIELPRLASTSSAPLQEEEIPQIHI